MRDQAAKQVRPSEVFDRVFFERAGEKNAGGHALAVVGDAIPKSSRLVSLRGGGTKALDPATIEMIISAADFLLSLFGDDDEEQLERSLEQIGRWINRVANELHRMNVLLEEIRDALRELRVYIDEAFRRDAEYETLSRVETYVANIAALRADPNSTFLREMFSDLYVELQAANRHLMHYGYAPLMSVLYGFRTELDLIRILRFPRATEATVAAHYRDYFAAALQPSIPGSIANNLVARDMRIAELEQQFTAGAKGFVGPAWYYKENCRERCTGHGADGRICEWTCKYWRCHPELEINGSISTSFAARVFIGNHLYADSSQPGGEYLESRDAVIAAAIQYVSSHNLVSYNAAVTEYRRLLEERAALNEARVYCEKFRDLCGRLAEA